jgi:hypothetical protein
MSGFRRDPVPFAFLLHAEGSYGEDLNIDRSHYSLGNGIIGLGLRPTSRDFLAATVNLELEDPATLGIDDDKDESASARWLQGHVGWQRRYALDDRLAMNLTFDLRKDERTNGDALFDGFSDLDASLYGKFQQASQVIFDTPLYDFSTEVLNAYLCRYVSRSICRRTCRRFYRSLKATSRSLNLSWIQFRASRGTRKTLKFRSAGFALMAASTGALVLRAATFTNGTTQS